MKSDPTGSEPVFRLAGIFKRYPGENHDVLSGVSLAIRSGDLISIIGDSGSGKTTILNLMGCVDTPTLGDIVLKGSSTAIMKPDALADLRSRHIGFIFQQYHLIEYLTVYQNLEVRFLYQRRQHFTDIDTRIISILEELEIRHLAAKYPRKLSGGEMQRVAICRALVMEPGLLLADEPTGNLDAKNSSQVFQILERYARKGTAVVLVTHDESLARRCPRQYRLKNGVLNDV